MAKRRSEKTVEIHEFYFMRSANGSLPTLCVECSTGEGIMVTPEQAAVVARVPVRTIYRWVESGLIHYQEAAHNSLIVCLKSLPIATDQSI